MSHLGLWEKIEKMDQPLVLVCEDDARFKSNIAKNSLVKIIEKAPAGSDLIWLNDYRRESPLFSRINRLFGTRKLLTNVRNMASKIGLYFGFYNFVFWKPVCEKTTEGYLISPRYAGILLNSIKDNIGAIDEHMRGSIATHGGKVYSLRYPILTQRDRQDSDIR